MRFAKEHPKEILVLIIRVNDWPTVTDLFGESKQNLNTARISLQ